MKYSVLLEITTCLSVNTMAGEIMIVHILKMLVLDALHQVCYKQFDYTLNLWFSLQMKQLVPKEIFVLWEVLMTLKDVLKYAMMVYGEPSVMTSGVEMMVELLVVNWDYHL